MTIFFQETGSDEVADKSAAEDQTMVKMVDEEGLEQTVVEETTSLTKEAELEDKYMTLDKPEPVEEDDNKKETTSEGVYELNLKGILKPNFWIVSNSEGSKYQF